MELLTAPKKTAYKETTLKVLSVIGGIAVIVGIAWVGIRGLSLFPNVGTFLANALAGLQSVFTPAERIVLGTIDSQIVVNKPFTLTWEHRGKNDDGSYAFSYECHDDIFLAQVDNGTQTTIFCNTEFPILADDTEIRLVAIGDVAGVAELPVKISFKENGRLVAALSGEATLLVQESYLDTATSTDTTTGTTGATGTKPTAGTPQFVTVPIITEPFSDPNGDIDLSVRVLGYGLVDRKTGVFSERDEIPQDLPSGKYAAIRFEVKNIGTKESGKWEFEVELPTSPSYTYDSPKQQTLFPGDKIEYTIGFDRVRNANEDEYVITVDPDDDIDESNERNNVEEGEVEIDR
ncbi:MAG: hypothetical protein AMXMBFR44_5740 [Candidatus Campbellbacteria bacterium]